MHRLVNFAFADVALLKKDRDKIVVLIEALAGAPSLKSAYHVQGSHMRLRMTK